MGALRAIRMAGFLAGVILGAGACHMPGPEVPPGDVPRPGEESYVGLGTEETLSPAGPADNP